MIDKVRTSGTDVIAHGVVGRVERLAPVIVDDLISTGGTIVAAVETLVRAGCIPEVIVAATHALLVGPASDRLNQLPLAGLISTDSVAPRGRLACPHQVVQLGPLIGRALSLLERGEPLDELRAAR